MRGIDHLAAFRERLAADGGVRNLEIEVRRVATGEPMWVSINARVVCDAADRPAGFEAAVVDVTERRRTEAALAEKTALLDAIFELLPDGVKYQDADLMIRAANRRFFEILGLDRERVLAAPVHMREAWRQMAERGDYGPGDVEELVAQRVAMLGSGDNKGFVLRRATGKWVETRAIRTPEGGLLTVDRDVTAAKEMEAALAEKTALLDAMFELMPDGVKLADAELNIKAVNGRFFEIVGLDRAQIMSAPHPSTEMVRQIALRGDYGPGRLEDLVERQLRLMRETPSQTVVRQGVDGRWREARAVRTPEGDTLAIYRDITDLRRAEAALLEKTRVLDATLALLPDGVLVLDGAFKPLAFNEQVFQILDVEGDRIVASGDPLRELLRQAGARRIRRRGAGGSGGTANCGVVEIRVLARHPSAA